MATTRKSETRAATKRKVTYTPPNMLHVDKEVKDYFLGQGYVLRWVRHTRSDTGGPDTKNLIYREREGWVPVKIDDIPDEYRGLYEIGVVGKNEGVILNNDVMLAMLPVETAEARKAYYEGLALDQERAIDDELRGSSSREMPIQNESRSTATRGRKPANFGELTENDEG
jgi:hypothetical protein